MINHRHIQCLMAGAAACLVLGGCGVGVNLSAEEETAVAEYAAGLLLKYDANYPNRLRPKEEVELVRETTADTNSSEEEVSYEPSPVPSDVEADREVAGRLLGADAPITASLSGVSLVLTYPGTGDSYVLEAEPGTEILVCEILVKNENSREITLDAMGAAPDIVVEVGSSKQYPALLTLLPDDLATYSGTLVPGEEKRLVVLTEIPATGEEEPGRVRVLLEKEERSSVLAETNY